MKASSLEKIGQALDLHGWSEQDVKQFLEDLTQMHILKLLRGQGVFLPFGMPGPVSLAAPKPETEPTPAPLSGGLIHDRFNSLEEKLAMVRGWPDVTDEDIRRALEEGKGRIARFERESPDNLLLDIIVSVYKPTAHETLAYARDRMRQAFGKEFWQWNHVYAEIVPKRVRWLDGIAVPAPGVRIEVVDLGANFNPEDSTVPTETRGPDSAHAAVIYAAAQDTEWVRQMDGVSVPYAVAAGFELDVCPGSGRWSHSLSVSRRGGGACLDADRVGLRYDSMALPSLREC